ncbi:hypothetical protein E0E52_14535 [Azotobacter chroococcum]|uniref:hypothetical protein n=1 Tax=Azotobacter chroococcum TaxID=353 RepID=UPI00103AD0F3|nr:hypothetical protein [Azotobacter chroococcum]TBW03704.1 hypothetical protein E0E52_14535 [Azotobacter chroococcum]
MSSLLSRLSLPRSARRYLLWVAGQWFTVAPFAFFAGSLWTVYEIAHVIESLPPVCALPG